tara:strand:- start:22243 stop:22992 length:750 start_codon:yes stop_codon:yes gene_type:complete
MNRGYLAVASSKPSFYYAAINCLESIKDYDPDAQTCLVVDEHLYDGRDHSIDHIIFTETPNEYRAKLWGMAKTPFDQTFYVDADTECMHEDIAKVWDEFRGNDMVFQALTLERDKAFKGRHFPAGSFQYNGGVCLYDSSKQHIRDFMMRWYDLYKLQLSDKWWPIDQETGEWDLHAYGKREEQKYWDQFTLWYLTNKEQKWDDLNIGIFKDDLRWNYFSGMGKVGIGCDNPIIVHYSSALSKDNDIYAS